MSEFWLVSKGESSSGRHQLVPPGPVTIGRAPGQTITVAERTISRLHATLIWSPPAGAEPGHWRVSDAGSQGGTFVNGLKLQAGRSLKLEPGDVLELPPLSFEFVDLAERSHVDATVVLASEDSEAVESVSVAEPTGFAQKQLLQLLSASEVIHSATDERAIYESLLDAVISVTGLKNAAFVRASGGEQESADLLAARGEVVDPFGRASISRSLLRKARFGPVVVKDTGMANATLNNTLSQLSVKRAICLPIHHGPATYGFLYMDERGASEGQHDLEAAASVAHALVRMAAMSLSNMARARMEQRLENEQRLMFGGTMHALIAAIDAKDPYTRGHSDRVSIFSHLLAHAARLGPEMEDRAKLCGQVHDIGKIGVPESILRKAGRLTDEEFAQIAAHPAIGHEILRDIPQMRDVLPGVLEHHEKWDGSGYPAKLAGEKISVLGRVVCIADSFDAMTSARTYRPARAVAEVLSEIRRCLGTHFDPELGEAFLGIPVQTLEQHIAPAMSPVLEGEPV